MDCDICGKPMESDDKKYTLWHKDREIIGHYPCFANVIAMWIDASDCAEEACAEQTPVTPARHRLRLFQKIRLGLRAVTSATDELERMGPGKDGD